MDGRNGNFDIFGYNLATAEERAICTEEHDQVSPAIGGDWVVWEDGRNRGPSDYSDIYAYNLTTGEERAICTEEGTQMFPAIGGDWVVWADLREDYLDVYGYNLITGEERAICAGSHRQGAPAIWGGWVVWADTRNSRPTESPTNWDIYGLRLREVEEEEASEAA